MFWKRARGNFRNVDSFDEEAVPVKVTYFEGESIYDVDSSPGDESVDKHASNQAVGEPSTSTTPPVANDPPFRAVVNSRDRSFDNPSPSVAPSTTNASVALSTTNEADDTADDTYSFGGDPFHDDSFEEKGPMDKKKMFVILACLFFLGVTLLVSGIAVRKKNKSKNNIDKSEGTSPTMAPTSANGPVSTPTSSPTFVPTFAGTLEGLDLWVETLSEVTDPRTFRQDSPQNRALQWISSEDAANMDPKTTAAIYLTERYIAAVLYFATSGEEWAQDLSFLTGDTICTWNFGGPDGISCNGGNSVSSIFIVDNNLKGAIPSEINHLKNLEVMNLYYNHLSGSLPDLGNLSALQQIDLDGNKLSGNVPASLFNLPSLERLLLLNNPELRGTIPEITSEAPRFERISFYNCNLSGSLPASLGRASGLTFLQFFDNNLTGSIPSSLTTLPNLTLFSLRGNQLTGSLPSFGGQASLETISLGENQLQGSLPAGLGDLSSLTTLYLDDNNLTGEVPSELNGLPLLEHVWLFSNNFEGNMPTFSNAGTLEQLYLDDNQFTGTLDTLIEQAPTSIQFLGLGGNPQVTGGLTGSIARFTSLQSFNVSFTGIAGTIPQEVANLDLGILSLHGTDMTGDLTAILCPDTTLPPSFTVLTADCGGPTPEVDCACCTECCADEGGATVCAPTTR